MNDSAESSEPSQQPATFKDRSGALKGVGCIQIMLGALFTCISPLTLISLIPAVRDATAEAGGAAVDARGLFYGFAFYLVLAVFFIWTGVGAMKARRWVRPLMLCLSWGTLVMGSLSLAILITISPKMANLLGSAGDELSAGIGVTLLLLMFGIIC